MRARMPLCRGVALLLLTGVAFLTMNVLFLWNQLQDGREQKCVCDCNNEDIKRSFAPSIELHTNTTTALPRDVTQKTTTLQTENSRIIVGTPGSPQKDHNEATNTVVNPHQLAVVVPFRNRFEELLEFAPHIHNFLLRQNVQHQIWVINQADKHR